MVQPYMSLLEFYIMDGHLHLDPSHLGLDRVHVAGGHPLLEGYVLDELP